MTAALEKMTRWTRRLAAPGRGFANFLLKLTRSGFSCQQMPDHANHKCLHLDSAMLECYHAALERFPEMAQRLALYIKNGMPLGEDFEAAFF